MLRIIRLKAILAVVLASVSCGANNHDQATAITSTDSTVPQILQESTPEKKQHVRNEITDSMLTQIINYYYKEYGSDSLRMNIVRSDTLLELSFEDTTNKSNDYQGTLFVAYISLVTDINPIVTGDINGDGRRDMLISIPTEGGGGGGNIWWNDHFLFIADGNGEDTLIDVKSDGEILDGSGYFSPKEIANQVITGIGNEYDESDGNCCPSLYYRIRVQLSNGHLSVIDKVAVPKPAESE